MSQQTQQTPPQPDKAPNTPPQEAADTEVSLTVVERAHEIVGPWFEQLLIWLQSPAFLAQVGAIFVGYILARIIAGKLRKNIEFFRDQPEDGKFLKLRNIGFKLRDLLFPTILVLLFAMISPVLKAVPALGQDWLVVLAQGLAVIFLLYRAIKRFIHHALVQKIVIWIGIPIAVLKVFGKFDEFTALMERTNVISLGNIQISALSIANLLIFGGLLFWIGRVSNAKGKAVIRNQDSLDAGTQEVFAKFFEIAVFGVLALLLINIAKIPTSSLVFMGSALMLGIGFGLQPIAANFVSGLILLLDGTLKKGDFIELPGGQQGYVEDMTMRSATVETTDGKDIMVPNVKFIEDSYENWTHKDPRQRYEVHFSVSYETDLDTLEDIVIPAVSKHPLVLQEPEKPDLELRSFGDFGINFAIEFWVDGIDDGKNKFTSDLNFIIWRTLKKHGIVMPLPQREVRNIK